MIVGLRIRYFYKQGLFDIKISNHILMSLRPLYTLISIINSYVYSLIVDNRFSGDDLQSFK